MISYLICFFILWITYRKWQGSRTICDYRSKYVVITGCDTGFGNLLAKRLDSLGFHVFAGCLTQDGMNQLNIETSSNVTPIRFDVSKTGSIEVALQTITKALPKDTGINMEYLFFSGLNTGIWGLVNNAGVSGVFAPLEWMKREDYINVLNINTLGMIETCRVFLPLLLKAKGRIVNVTSVAGICGGLTSPYTVSKFAAEGYSDVLRRDLYKRGVTVHIIEPGGFKTSIIDVKKLANSLNSTYNKLPEDLQNHYGQDFCTKYMEATLQGIRIFASTRSYLVVDAYTHALTALNPKYRYLVGYDAKYFIRWLILLPEWVADFLFGNLLPVPVAEEK